MKTVGLSWRGREIWSLVKRDLLTWDLEDTVPSLTSERAKQYLEIHHNGGRGIIVIV